VTIVTRSDRYRQGRRADGQVQQRPKHKQRQRHHRDDGQARTEVEVRLSVHGGLRQAGGIRFTVCSKCNR